MIKSTNAQWNITNRALNAKLPGKLVNNAKFIRNSNMETENYLLPKNINK